MIWSNSFRSYCFNQKISSIPSGCWADFNSAKRSFFQIKQMRYFEAADELLNYNEMPPDPYVSDYSVDCSEEPEPIREVWAYTWNDPDTSNVNAFDLVKPMVWLDSNKNQRYDLEPRPTINQLNTHAVSKLNDLPSGKRVLYIARYNSGAIWLNPSDYLTGGFRSPWPSIEAENVKNEWESILHDLVILDAKIDMITLDNESSGSGGPYWWEVPCRFDWLDAIVNDPRYGQSWKGGPSFSSSMVPFDIYSICNYTSTNDYSGYSRAIGRMGASTLNYALWNPVKAAYPNIKGSNYGGVLVTQGDSYPDVNGHEVASDSIFGNSSGPYLYGSWGNVPPPDGPGSRVINPDDPTRMIVWNGIDPQTPASVWLGFLIDIQGVRACKRANETLSIEPDIDAWIASVSWTGDIAFNYLYKNNKSYYYEMIRHAVLNGTQRFAVWNPFEFGSNAIEKCGYLDDVLRAINEVIISATKECITTERISYYSDYLISGIKRRDGKYLWRITPKPGTSLTINSGTILTDSSNNGGYTDVGYWIITNTASLPSVST